MEFVFADINMETLVCMPCAQAEVEGELPLPEGRRASDTEVLSANGTVMVSRCAAAEGAVVIEGRVRAELVCRDASFVPDEGGNAADAVFAFSSSAAFRYVMDAPGVKEGMAVSARAAIFEMNVEQGGRLTFSSTVELLAAVTTNKPIRALSAVKGAETEFKNVKYSYLAEQMIGCEETRLREEIAARGVLRVLCAQAEASVRSVKTGGDSALVEATGYVSALVVTDAGRVETFASQIPLSFEIALDARASGDAVAEIAVAGSELYVVGEGTLCLETTLRVKVFDVCPGETLLPGDAYMPGAPLTSVLENADLMLRGGHVMTRCSVDEKLTVPDGMPQPARIVWCAARPLVTSVSADCGTLCVEGVVSVRAVYEAADGSLHAFGTQIPFACDAACPCWCSQARASAKLLCAGLTLSGNTLVFSAALEISAAPFCPKTAPYVTGLEPYEAKSGRRSLILCYAGAGETLFDVGRRYGLSRAALIAANPDIKEELDEGERLIFIGRA